MYTGRCNVLSYTRHAEFLHSLSRTRTRLEPRSVRSALIKSSTHMAWMGKSVRRWRKQSEMDRKMTPDEAKRRRTDTNPTPYAPNRNFATALNHAGFRGDRLV